MVTAPTVQHISPDSIAENPENPRVVFKPKDMQTLLESIDKRGVIVPLIVYLDDGRFTLLDGARRLRCALRLNLNTVPVNIVAKPNAVENILQMFHIHNVRKAWELIETAKKLRVLLEDAAFKNKSSKQIGELAGLSTTTVNRCKQLLALDPSYQKMILQTYKRAEKGEEIEEEGTKMTEDFFIESQRAINSIKRFQKDILDEYSETQILAQFVKKRRTGTFSNVIEIGRLIPRIVSAGRKGGSQKKVSAAIRRLIEDPAYKIQDAYKIAAEPVLFSIGLEKKSAALVEELNRVREYPKKELESRKNELIIALRKLQEAIRQTLAELK
jgi:ParB family chromosome partitioning protein